MSKKIKNKAYVTNIDENDKRKKKLFLIIGLLVSAAAITTAALVTHYLTIKEFRHSVTLTFNAKDGVFADTQLKEYKLEVEKTTHFKDILDKVNQPKLANYVFEGWKNGNQIVEDFVINGDVTLNASYIAPQARSFATDSWSTIACFADQGLDKLKEVYQPAGGTFVITDEDDTEVEIAAKTRSVSLNGLGTFDVRVIGENHDYLSNAGNKVAALTFEFSEIINPAVPDKFREFDDYITSNMRHYIQSDVYGSTQVDLRSNLRLVRKEACSILTLNLITIDDYFFPLSFAEIADVKKNGVALVQEGSLYEYYQNPNHSIKKLYHDDETYNFYRLRSLDDERGTWLLNVVDEGISSSASETLSGGSGIAPAFCIGESVLTNDNSYRVTWDNTTFSGDADFLTDLNSHLDSPASSVQDAYTKTTSTLEEYASEYLVSSNNDLVIDLIGIDTNVPEKDTLSELENDGYTFIKVAGAPLSSEDYEVNFYTDEDGSLIWDHSRCEIVIPAEKITGDVELTLFSYIQ